MGQSEMLKVGYIWPEVGWKLLPILLINIRENETLMFFIDFRYVGIMIIIDNLEIITQGATLNVLGGIHLGSISK